MKFLITGGAGFVGSSLGRLIKGQFPKASVTAFDNLRRSGSELNLPKLRELGIKFVHGDIRNPSDLQDLPEDYDVFIEASAEPSVHAGTAGASPRYVLDTNLTGTLNCLEFARKRCAGLIFLSTSRVYSIPALREIPLKQNPTRLELDVKAEGTGLSNRGIAETFPCIGAGFRSFYGSTKLASELFIEEYAANYNYPAVINRCGVIAGAGQFGKTDQGVFTLWVARHLFGGTLSYTGFGGEGKQVRDLLHPRDLFSLIQKQIEALPSLRAEVFNVGGGLRVSASLQEYTRLCEEVCGKSLKIANNPQTAAVDVPYYVSDCQRVEKRFAWQPQLTPKDIVMDIHGWLKANAASLQPLFT